MYPVSVLSKTILSCIMTDTLIATYTSGGMHNKTSMCVKLPEKEQLLGRDPALLPVIVQLVALLPASHKKSYAKQMLPEGNGQLE